MQKITTTRETQKAPMMTHKFTTTTHLRLQQWQGLLEHTIALQRGSRITVLQAAVIDTYDLVGALDHLSVDGALDRLLW